MTDRLITLLVVPEICANGCSNKQTADISNSKNVNKQLSLLFGV